MPGRRDTWAAVGLLTLTTTVWAATFPVYKVLLTVWTPVQVQFWRYAVGAAAMVLLGGVRWHRSPTEIARGVGIGCALWVGFTAQAYGIRYTTASRAAFLTALLVLFGPVLYFALRGRDGGQPARSLSPAYVFYWVLALAGVGLLTLRGWTWDWNRGDTLSVMAALGFSLQMVLVDRWVDPAEGRGYAFLQVITVALGTALWALVLRAPLVPDPTPAWVWGCVAALGVFPSWLAFEWQMRAQPCLQTPVASFIYAMEPLEAALLSWGLVGERLAVEQWLGGLLIVGAVLGTASRMGPGRKEAGGRAPRLRPTSVS